MRRAIGWCLLLLTAARVQGADAPGPTPTPLPPLVWHNGSVQADGTVGPGHYQTKADGDMSNNLSTKGNLNPFTGEMGTKTATPLHRGSSRPEAPTKEPKGTASQSTEGIHGSSPEYIVYTSGGAAGFVGLIPSARTKAIAPPLPAERLPEPASEPPVTVHCQMESGKATSVAAANYVRTVDVRRGLVYVTLTNGTGAPVRPNYEVRFLDGAGVSVGRVCERGHGVPIAPEASRETQFRAYFGDKQAVSVDVTVQP